MYMTVCVIHNFDKYLILTVKMNFPLLAPLSEPVNPMSLCNLHLTEETSHDLYR